MTDDLNPDENDIHVQILDELSKELAVSSENVIGFVFPEPETCEFRSVQGNALGAKVRNLAYDHHLENGTTCKQIKRYLIAILDEYTEECRRELALVGLDRVFRPGSIQAYDLVKSFDDDLLRFSGPKKMIVASGTDYIYPAATETMLSAKGMQSILSSGIVEAGSLLFHFDADLKSYTWRHTKSDGVLSPPVQGVVSEALGIRLMRSGQEPIYVAGWTHDSRAVALYPISDPMNLYSRPSPPSGNPKVTGVGSIYLAVVDSLNGNYETLPEWVIETFAYSNTADVWEIRTKGGKNNLKPIQTTEERLRARYGIELSDFPNSLQEFLTKAPSDGARAQD